ncbi:ArsR family transcriptional regulator [Rhodoferax aquaticus]|uniref:ArsR family transcriptional regulator n=1 Tax=Rhodoferax aquaticus TaxID=2527691 RepID=A0A515ERQ3_9BURK|nr:ArsR family transcriptional regulator [Rhodoferax aquaticus]QDL55334.1 ArsR family transcriptional regulator [Rhodoferax aquaticus]
MSEYANFLRADLRLVILRILSEMPGYRANSSILANLLHQMGHATTRDQAKTEMRWLAEQGLLKLEEVGSVIVATLTERGQDVAEGRSQVDGIARPRA